MVISENDENESNNYSNYTSDSVYSDDYCNLFHEYLHIKFRFIDIIIAH